MPHAADVQRHGRRTTSPHPQSSARRARARSPRAPRPGSARRWRFPRGPSPRRRRRVAFSAALERVRIGRPCPTPRRPASPSLRSARTSARGDRRNSRSRSTCTRVPGGHEIRDRRFPSRTCPCRTPRTRTTFRRTEQARQPLRTSSSIAIISGSRWLTVGAAIARITRGEVRLGPGPSRMRSLSGSSAHDERDLLELTRARRSSAATAAVGPAASGGRGRPTSQPTSCSAALSPGTPYVAPTSFAIGTSRRCSAPASSWRPPRVSSNSRDARIRQHAREREDAAGRADAQRRIERRRRSGEDV